MTTVLLHDHLLTMALSGCEDLWLCGVSESFVLTVLVLASPFSHPGSLTNTHTSWQLSPRPCGFFFSLLLRQKEFKYFLSTHSDQRVAGSFGP